MGDKGQQNQKGQKVSPLVKLAAPSGTVGRALVPPVLQEVGKLAAGVAAVNTASGSATGKENFCYCGWFSLNLHTIFLCM